MRPLTTALSFALLGLAACAPGADEPAAPDQPAAAASTHEPAGPATPGNPAPAFTLTDTNGQEHSLADYRGRTVVLEWLNYDCPFTRKHYEGRNMQALQERYTGRGVVWLSLNTSAPGDEGNYPPDELNRRTAAHGGRQTALLVDPTGAVGRAYNALTTPHMFVISPEGEVAYNGAIDDQPSPNPATLEGARSYVSEALDAVLTGEPVALASTQPYGCSVHYPES
jgi:peroxiredoxin